MRCPTIPRTMKLSLEDSLASRAAHPWRLWPQARDFDWLNLRIGIGHHTPMNEEATKLAVIILYDDDAEYFTILFFSPEVDLGA